MLQVVLGGSLEEKRDEVDSFPLERLESKRKKGMGCAKVCEGRSRREREGEERVYTR